MSTFTQTQTLPPRISSSSSPSTSTHRVNPHKKSTPLTSTVHRPTTETRLAPVLTSTVTPRPSLKVKIDDKWYDISKWQLQHPGGYDVLQHMDGLDATDAFYSLHSKEAIQRLQRMSSTAAVPGDTPPPSQATINFRKFRKELESEGWFKKNPLWEMFYFSSVFGLSLLGTIFCIYGYSTFAIICIGLAMQQAGWIGHDHTHGRGEFNHTMVYFHSGIVGGLSRSWWSNKHNTHHVFTNHLGIDVDIENDPVIHLFFPTLEKDTTMRKYQHYYYAFAYSFLFLSWRIQSFQHAWKHKVKPELATMAINYAWLLFLGWYVAILSVLLAGFLVAIIVTVTHQSEEMLGPEELKNFSFVEGQFLTTRNAWSKNPFMNWLWGGMQYQLEHHLFPTMPKYKYRSLIPRVQQFAKDNGLEYRVESPMDVWKRNADTIKYYAGEHKH